MDFNGPNGTRRRLTSFLREKKTKGVDLCSRLTEKLGHPKPKISGWAAAPQGPFGAPRKIIMDFTCKDPICHGSPSVGRVAHEPPPWKKLRDKGEEKEGGSR